MTLKEQIHRSIDTLDNHSLTLIYEQIQVLQKSHAESNKTSSAPSLEAVLKLTSRDPSEWSDDIIAERAERL